MWKEAKKVIKIAKFIAPIVSSRDVASNLESAILKAKSEIVDLDFSDVEFVSRSATHALLSIKEDLQRRQTEKKVVSFVNANEEVQEMFRIIAANRAMPKIKPNFEAEKVNILNIA